jgi:energy-converting hydrogenase B subunit D
MTGIHIVLLLLTAASGTAVVLLRNPLRQTIMLGLHGSALALLLLTLRAPDVALAQIAVGTVALPLMFLAAIATVRRRRPEGDPDSARRRPRQ